MGEFERIADITQRLHQQANVLIGPGDDAASLRTPHSAVLASTDILVEGVHFKRAWTTPYALGRRAAAQNFSDINAMGCTATAILVAVAAPQHVANDWYLELARGLQAECDLVGASVIGGDLSRGDAIVISVTVLGDPEGAPVTRAGAQHGDVVAVAGRLGWSAMGWLSLVRGIDVGAQMLDAYRTPEPPYAAGPAARIAGASSMIDVSDGLLADAAHIADASHVTLLLETALLTPDPEVSAAANGLGVEALTAVLTGGEDHALLATFPPGAAIPAAFRPIGKVATRGETGVLVDGLPHSGPTGWVHFG